MKDVIGLLNTHDDPELGELTANRPLASTTFLGRYAFMDIVMSNFSNSGIDTVGILIKNHQRSILKHMGNMSSWVNNTKTDKLTILLNEKGILNPAYNTDLANIKENDYLLYDSSASIIVFQTSHIVAPIDFNPIINGHRANKDEVTVVYKKIHDGDKDFVGGYCFDVDENGYVQEVRVNDGSKKDINASLETWIINRVVLAKIVKESKKHSFTMGIGDYLRYAVENKLLKIRSYEYKGYARNFNSLNKYIEYSFELLKPEVAASLFREEWPIFTITHNTTPALYKTSSKISNSFIANGCVINGSVTNSILCRGVHVGKGAKLDRCIVLRGTKIGEKVTLSNVVIDKYSIVTDRHTIEGDKDTPIYIHQGAII